MSPSYPLTLSKLYPVIPLVVLSSNEDPSMARLSENQCDIIKNNPIKGDPLERYRGLFGPNVPDGFEQPAAQPSEGDFERERRTHPVIEIIRNLQRQRAASKLTLRDGTSLCIALCRLETWITGHHHLRQRHSLGHSLNRLPTRPLDNEIAIKYLYPLVGAIVTGKDDLCKWMAVYCLVRKTIWWTYLV